MKTPVRTLLAWAPILLLTPCVPSVAPAATWVEAITNSAPKYWYRFNETDQLFDQATNSGTAAGWNGVYGADVVLNAPSVLAGLGTALEFTGPASGSATTKFVDLAVNGLDSMGAPLADPNTGIPELINVRPPTVDKSTTVEYWIRTSQRGSTADQTWTSPSLLAHESGGDGDMYWGWISAAGDFGFSTSDLVEIFAQRDGNRTITDSNWHHIVMVKEWHVSSASISRMYIDGGTNAGGMTIVRNTAAGNASYQDADGGIRYLGYTQTGGGGDVQFIGLIDELAIYDRALTPVEVANHYNAVAGVDTDGDGMPDIYELANGFNINVNDASQDADSDGSTNLAEFQKRTNPRDADTDDDGLNDGVETGTGTWVSATNTGTNPLVADTDGDGLRDGVETNTGTFVSATNTGTNPHSRDTDGDSYDDAGEITVGSNPNSASSLPPAGNWPAVIRQSAPKYWWRFEETDAEFQQATNSGSATGWHGVYGAGMAGNVGKPSVLPVLGSALEFTGPAAGVGTTKFVDLAANGLDSGGNPVDPNAGVPELTNVRPPTTDKSTTVEYWIRTQQRGGAANQTWNSPSLLAHESGGDGDMYWGWVNDTGDFGFSTSDLVEIFSRRDTNKVVTDGQWHHVVLIKEWHVTQPSVSRMYIDGGKAQGGATIIRNTAAGNASYQDADGGIRYLGFTQTGGSANLQYIGMFDELVIYDRALSETEVRQHYRAVYEADTDGDTMPDAYEISNNLNPNVNDANQDADNDSLTNVQEFQRGTNPQNPDTDGDGARDGSETDTGVFVSVNNRGTDPFDPDTDHDGLLDGVESNTGTFVDANNTGTNPHSLDTDADRFKDADEVALGTNPNSAASTPSVPSSWTAAVRGDQPLYWWRFEETTVANGVTNAGSAAGFAGMFGGGILDTDLGKTSAASGLGNAIQFTGPASGAGTTKFVDFGAAIPELINSRTAPVDGKTTTVEYWIKTAQRGSTANQTWTSPSIFARESGGDGDMYWGWVNATGQFGFSTSDITEIYANGVTDSNWHHVVLTKIWNQTNPSISRLYIDGGALSGGQTFEVTTGAGAISQQDDDGAIQYLGYVQTGGGTDVQFIGLIDEVAIYNSAFNEGKARIHYLSAGAASANYSIRTISVNSTTRDVTITWQATSGSMYTVQRASDLNGPWSDIGQVTATSDTGTFTDTGRPATAGAWFYRIRRN